MRTSKKTRLGRGAAVAERPVARARGRGGRAEGRERGAPPDYVERVNLVIDHIVANLERPLRLKALADIAAFSPFHFHRVFQGMVGETPADFVKRLRLDRAVVMMTHARREPLTRVALRCGFASASDFSRSFKQRFGAAPSALDLEGWRTKHSAAFDAMAAGPGADARVDWLRSRSGSNPDGFRVKLRGLPPMTVAYIRVSEPYKGDAVVRAVHRLMAWAEREGFIDNQWLGYQWENPNLVSLEQCRYHAAVRAERFTARGEIGRYRFPAMTVAEVEIRGGIDLEIRALRWLYGVWLPRSGYVPDDQPAFEAWIGRPFALGMKRFALHVWLPVRRW